MANKSLKTLDIITVLMKNDRVREFEWLDTRSSEEQSMLAHTNEKPVLPEGFEFLPVKRSIVIKKKKIKSSIWIYYLKQIQVKI